MVHCLLIGWDVEMYWEDNNSPAQARTTTLNEELATRLALSRKTGFFFVSASSLDTFT
ncbi:hypothetical protein M9458_043956, partial [Cirrhinus mrigala]